MMCYFDLNLQSICGHPFTARHACENVHQEPSENSELCVKINMPVVFWSMCVLEDGRFCCELYTLPYAV